MQFKYSGGNTTTPTATDPSWTPIVNAAGDITAGDLFYVNTTGNSGDLVVELSLTNPEALKKNYAYILLLINVYSGGEGSWAQATRADSSAIGTVYLTLTNGYVSFILDGDIEYVITIDGGSFFCIDTNASGGSLSPAFYIEANPA